MSCSLHSEDTYIYLIPKGQVLENDTAYHMKGLWLSG